MAEPILVDVAWKTATYVLCTVVVGLAGTIAKMAHWFMKERIKMAADYQGLSTRTLKYFDRVSDHLRDLHNALSPEKASRTRFDFNGEKER